MTMESAMLKEIVLPPTLMRKLLNVAGVSGSVESRISCDLEPNTNKADQDTSANDRASRSTYTVAETGCAALEQ